MSIAQYGTGLKVQPQADCDGIQGPMRPKTSSETAGGACRITFQPLMTGADFRNSWGETA